MTYLELAALRDAAAQAAAAVSAAQRRVDELMRQHARPQEIVAAQAALARAAQAVSVADASYQSALQSTVAALDPRVPLLLLPVRLETRFRASTVATSVDLLIRVYPDDIHLDGHEIGVTDAELEAGQHFWRTAWTAANDRERAAAWKQLADRVGSPRAAFLLRRFTPTNDPQSGQAPAFPTVTTHPARWTRAVRAEALPDRWVALAYRDGQRIALAQAGLISRPLAAGPSPVSSQSPADDAMRWMVDFAAARTAGMGLVMTLDRHQADRIDRLLVVGVRGTDSAADSAQTLTALLDAHQYTWALDLVPVGTPTNNTSDVRAGQPADPSWIPLPQVVAAGSDADLVVRALGLSGASRGPFDTIANAALHDQRDAADMAAVLWPATWGYFLSQLMRPQFSGIDLEAWRRWFVTTVRGRGPLPSIRAGDQPYGVLPVTSLDRWRPDPDLRELMVLLSDESGRGPSASVRILWDLDASGSWSSAGDPMAVVLPAGATASGLAAIDVDADGHQELVVGWFDSRRAGYVVLRLSSAGTDVTTLVQGDIPVNGAPSGLTLAVMPGPAGRIDLVVILQEAVTGIGGRTHAVVRVGDGLTGHRPIERWVDPVELDRFAVAERLLGVAVQDVDGNGTPELVLLTGAGGTVQYRVGTGFFTTGGAHSWSAPVEVTSGGVASTGGGITFADVNSDGAPEVIAHYTWDGGGTTAGAYRVGGGLDASGRPAQWDGPYNTGSGVPGRPLAGGVAVVDAGRSHAIGWTDETARINLLQRLRQVWQAAAANVPRVGAIDADAALLELLATDATSSSVAIRATIGPLVASSLWFAVGDPLASTYRADLEAQLTRLFQQWGVTATPRIASLAYADSALDATVPLVTSGAGDEPVDYLAHMAAASPKELHGDWIDPATPLLARLIRHSLLQAYADAAFRLLPVAGPSPLPEPELVDLADIAANDPVTPAHTLTSWRHLSEASYQGRPVASVLYDAARSANPPVEVRPLAEVIQALTRLAGASASTLQRLLMETLDLSTHRLDAWLTAIATDRLRALRARQAAGIHIGGYGFVTDLKPAAAAASTGYVHAPSVTHAATAAVLRSGYLTHGSNTFAIDLSSSRSRLALDLLDGIRAGQPLAALLGYRFERELHERQLSAYLPMMRQLAPEVVGQTTPAPAETAVEAVSGLPTVDGVALLRKWTENAIPWGATVPGQSASLPSVGTSDHTALLAALAAVGDVVDAVADLGLAESVHQAVQGNYLRAGGTLDALSRGELPPPDPMVVRSPRTGIGLTHRILVLVGADAESKALEKWTATDQQRAQWVRAVAEPRLNQWAALVLGDPARVRWRVALVDQSTGKPSGHEDIEFTLADAGPCPLDILYGPAPSVASLAETDVGRRLLLHAAASTRALDPPVVPRLIADRSDQWSSDVLTLADLFAIAEAARDLVGGARAVDARDLEPAGTGQAQGIDAAELSTRADDTAELVADALAALKTLFAVTAADVAVIRTTLVKPDIPATLASLVDLPPHVNIAAACAALGRPAANKLDDVRNALGLLAACGISEAAPRSAAGGSDGDRASLAAQAHGAAKEAGRRISAAGNAADSTTRIQSLLGSSFRVLPLFSVSESSALTAARDARSQAADASQWVLGEWLDGAARVRAGARRFLDANLVAAAAAGKPPSNFEAIQFPVRADDRWAGVPLAPGTTFPGGLTSIVIASAQPVKVGVDLAGLAVDEWVEVVPRDEETTAVAFHYDAPGACAPQALLLAVSPDPSRAWDVDTLEAVLLDTVEATCIRAVQPHHLQGVGHLVPALFFARNIGGDPAGDTIATLFRN
jgi:hypothetical protein